MTETRGNGFFINSNGKFQTFPMVYEVIRIFESEE